MSQVESLVFIKELSISLTALKSVHFLLLNKGKQKNNAYLFQNEDHLNKMNSEPTFFLLATLNFLVN